MRIAYSTPIKHSFSQFMMPVGRRGEGWIRPISSTIALTAKMLACTFRSTANRLLSSSRFLQRTKYEREEEKTVVVIQYFHFSMWRHSNRIGGVCVCVAQMNALYAHNKIGVDLIDFFSLFFCSILIPFRRISNLLAFDSLASLYHSPFRPLPPQTNTCSTDTTSFRFTDLISWHRSIEYHPNEISL